MQFDFPNENGKPYKSSGGEMVYNEILKREIPKGWDVVPMGKIIEIKSGFPFQSSIYLSTGKYQIITIKNVQDGYLDIIDTDFIEKLPVRIPDYCRLKKGDSLISLTGNIGRVGRVYTKNLLLNQRVGYIDCKNGLNNWAYLHITTTQIRRQIEKLGIGSAQSNVSPIQIGKIKMALPPKSILLDFEQRVTSFLNQVIRCNEENLFLIKQRNELLPLLMNGQVNFDFFAQACRHVHPYLLRNLPITHRNQVWSTAISYVPLEHGFMYLYAMIDVYSRYVLGWCLSNTLSARNYYELLQECIEKHGTPEIVNSDQGSQYTAAEWEKMLADNHIRISMDDRGRCIKRK